MEAESIGMMPFASLVSQEVVDEFLRVGGNTDDLRLVIGTAIMKQLLPISSWGAFMVETA